MKKILNIGIIGFGAMGKTHAFCAQNIKYFYPGIPFEARVFGICTTDFSRTEQICRDFGFPFAAKSEDELISNPEIDVISICTPNIYHFETIKKALAAGKHIYCEKPLCVTLEQAREVRLLAEKSGVCAGIVFNNRHLSPIIRAKELINASKIGRVLSFSAEYLHNSNTNPKKPAGWKQNRDICGGGVLFDLGSHCIDLIYFLCGEFSAVRGMSQIAFPTRIGSGGGDWETNADEAFYLMSTLKSGAMGTITVSKLANGSNDDLNFSVYGESGSLKFSLMQPNFLYYYNAENPQNVSGATSGYTAVECVGRYPEPGGTFPSPKAPQGWLRGHVGSLYSFLDAVFTGSEPSPSFADGAHVQAVIEAAYLSDKTRREVGVQAH